MAELAETFDESRRILCARQRDASFVEVVGDPTFLEGWLGCRCEANELAVAERVTHEILARGISSKESAAFL